MTPPLVAAGERGLDCYLVNVGKKSREVTIQVFSREGAIVEDVQTTLDPGEEGRQEASEYGPSDGDGVSARGRTSGARSAAPKCA